MTIDIVSTHESTWWIPIASCGVVFRAQGGVVLLFWIPRFKSYKIGKLGVQTGVQTLNVNLAVVFGCPPI